MNLIVDRPLYRARSACAPGEERLAVSQTPTSASTIVALWQARRRASVIPPGRNYSCAIAGRGYRHVAASLWRAGTVNRKVMAGSSIVAVFVLVAILGPIIIHQNPLHYTKDLVQPPITAHWLGTNQGGQDVFVQLVVGYPQFARLGLRHRPDGHGDCDSRWPGQRLLWRDRRRHPLGHHQRLSGRSRHFRWRL